MFRIFQVKRVINCENYPRVSKGAVTKFQKKKKKDISSFSSSNLLVSLRCVQRVRFHFTTGEGEGAELAYGIFCFSHKKENISNKAVAVRIDVFGVLCAQAPML